MNPAEHITLNFPIERDGLPIQEIALRRPTVGDYPECRIYSERCIARRWFAYVPAAWPVPPDCGGHPAGGAEAHPGAPRLIQSTSKSANRLTLGTRFSATNAIHATVRICT